VVYDVRPAPCAAKVNPILGRLQMSGHVQLIAI